jgi:curli production assembly/transport component CsgE
MRGVLTILFILTFTLTGIAQPDTLIQSTVRPNDTLLKDTTQLKEAPESLQKMIGEITKQQEQVSKDAELELDGMLFDETKTKSGKDFYDYFYSMWEAPPGARNFSIFITEKPYRLTTTQIEIKINETLVFQSFLQPRADIVEQLAEYAVAQTQMYLANYEELMRQMEGEDQAGTGIY